MYSIDLSMLTIQKIFALYFQGNTNSYSNIQAPARRQGFFFTINRIELVMNIANL